jgi:hypothetical protein
MDGALHILLGLTSFVLANLTLFLSAYRLATRLDLSLVDKAIALIAFSASQIIFSVLVCATFGHLERFYVLVVSLAVSSLIILFVPKGKPFLEELWDSIFRAFRKEPFLVFVLLPFVAFYLALYTSALFLPPLGYDPLNYHLTIAATAIQRHDLSPVFFPRFFHLYSYFPENAVLFSIWAMLLMGCDLFLPFVNLPFLLLWLFSVHKIARHFNVSLRLSLLFSCTTLTFPMMANLATEAYADPVLWACFLGGIRFALLGTRGFVPAMLLCGILFGTKTTSIPLSLLVVFVAVHSLLQTSSARFKEIALLLALFFGSVLVFGSFFYIRNIVLAGNPFTPIPVRIFGDTTIFEGARGLDTALMKTTVLSHFSYLWDSGLLMKDLVGEVYVPQGSFGLGPLGTMYLLAGPFAGLFILKQERQALPILLSGFFIVLSFLLTPYSGTFMPFNVRFVVGAPVLFGLLLIRALHEQRIPEGLVGFLLLLFQILGFFYSHLCVDTKVFLAFGIGAVLSVAFVESKKKGMMLLPVSTIRRSFCYGALVLIGILCLSSLHEYKVKTRIEKYRNATEPFRIAMNIYADCLEAVEKSVPRGKLAIALNETPGFMYPFFGSHLERELLYVNIGHDDFRLHYMYPMGNPRTSEDKEAWLRRLLDASPDALLVLRVTGDRDEPVEAKWALEREAIFKKVYQSEWCSLFLVDNREQSRQ